MTSGNAAIFVQGKGGWAGDVSIGKVMRGGRGESEGEGAILVQGSAQNGERLKGAATIPASALGRRRERWGSRVPSAAVVGQQDFGVQNYYFC